MLGRFGQLVKWCFVAPPKVVKVIGFLVSNVFNQINWCRVALPKVAIVLGFLVVIFLKQIKCGHMELTNYKRFLRFFL